MLKFAAALTVVFVSIGLFVDYFSLYFFSPIAIAIFLQFLGELFKRGMTALAKSIHEEETH